jgi:hypothetical protein
LEASTPLPFAAVGDSSTFNRLRACGWFSLNTVTCFGLSGAARIRFCHPSYEWISLQNTELQSSSPPFSGPSIAKGRKGRYG